MDLTHSCPTSPTNRTQVGDGGSEAHSVAALSSAVASLLNHLSQTKGTVHMMILKPAPEHVCDQCGLPLDESYIHWSFPRTYLRLHRDCARMIASRLRNNAYQLQRYQEKLEQTPNQETPERLLPVSAGTQSTPATTSTGHSPMGLRDTRPVARPA